MGAYIATAFAGAHPDRVSALVLVDGGLAVPSSFGEDADEIIEPMVDAALEHARPTYASADEYVAAWRAHPAFADDWTDDVDRYARYDVAGEPGAVRSVVSEAAVRADIVDLTLDERARTGVERVDAPITLLTAPRGLRNDYALLPKMLVDAFAATHPRAMVERIPDVNHYTVLLGGRGGPVRVAAAIAHAGGAFPAF
jgi:pimeloyl-ACP methyl ester carboxylesterase